MEVAQRKKRGKEATPEGKAARIEKLRASSSVSLSHSNAAAESANPDRPLTEKQKEFVRFWAQGETILSASIKAGYSDHGTIAYKLARDPAILKIYHREKALYEETCQMTRKRVMEGLLEGIELAKVMAEPASVIAGWKTVGQMCGYFEPVKRTIDINVKGDVTIKQLERMNDSDLLRIIKGEVSDVVFKEVEENTPNE